MFSLSSFLLTLLVLQLNAVGGVELNTTPHLGNLNRVQPDSTGLESEDQVSALHPTGPFPLLKFVSPTEFVSD